jgi:hypothetical protein
MESKYWWNQNICSYRDTTVKNAAIGDTVKTKSFQLKFLGRYLYADTPLVKIPRPISKVNFSYSANQDKIILTTQMIDFLENVIFISVTGVQDLNGNTI